MCYQHRRSLRKHISNFNNNFIKMYEQINNLVIFFGDRRAVSLSVSVLGFPNPSLWRKQRMDSYLSSDHGETGLRKRLGLKDCNGVDKWVKMLTREAGEAFRRE